MNALGLFVAALCLVLVIMAGAAVLLAPLMLERRPRCHFKSEPGRR